MAETKLGKVELSFYPEEISKELILDSFRAYAATKIEKKDYFFVYHPLFIEDDGISFSLCNGGDVLLMRNTSILASFQEEYGFGKKKMVSLVHSWLEEIEGEDFILQFLIPCTDEAGSLGFVVAVDLTDGKDEIAGYLELFEEVLRLFASTFDSWLQDGGYLTL
ncbi:MAG: hypothetical protein IAA97_00140 [Spirochaetes bacterium]|uniref:Uncharacterized protein n=1 Tax=Candidatus Ornithospirochaeta stercoripullorum TaxID=2840899 RepID=A0A9D9H4B7_9SPIO|nr:hypothetical protein [Candidatus Ornithospirochaeta stercoripullorum]